MRRTSSSLLLLSDMSRRDDPVEIDPGGRRRLPRLRNGKAELIGRRGRRVIADGSDCRFLSGMDVAGSSANAAREGAAMDLRNLWSTC